MGGRGIKVVGRLAGTAAVVLVTFAGTCDSGPSPKMRITREQRSAGGRLTAVTVEGTGFTKNGSVRISFFFKKVLDQGAKEELLSITPPQPPATFLTADAAGNVQFDGDRGLVCPDVGTGRGTWVSIVGNDVTSGKSGVAEFRRGRESDCVGR